MRGALLIGILLLAFPGAAPAAAADIAAVWSFQGGQVAVHPSSDGSLKGTVIRPTTSTSCHDEIGGDVWTELRAQPDGSYWGRQLFHDGHCDSLGRGNAAYRVLAGPDRSRLLRVCLAAVDDPGQPTIAADGTVAGASVGCVDAGPASGLPVTTPRLADFTSLPKARHCWDFGFLNFNLLEPPGDALDVTRIYRNGKLIAVRTRARISHPPRMIRVSAANPRKRFTVKVVARTVLGHRLTGRRTYRMCRTISLVGETGT